MPGKSVVLYDMTASHIRMEGNGSMLLLDCPITVDTELTITVVKKESYMA